MSITCLSRNSRWSLHQSLARPSCCLVNVCCYLPWTGKVTRTVTCSLMVQPRPPGQDALHLCAGCALQLELHFQPSESLRQSAYRAVISKVCRVLLFEKYYKTVPFMKNKEQTSLRHTKYWENVGQLSVYFYSADNHICARICLLTPWLCI